MTGLENSGAFLTAQPDEPEDQVSQDKGPTPQVPEQEKPDSFDNDGFDDDFDLDDDLDLGASEVVQQQPANTQE